MPPLPHQSDSDSLWSHCRSWAKQPRHRRALLIVATWIIFVLDWHCSAVSQFARWTVGFVASGESAVQTASTLLRVVAFTSAFLATLLALLYVFPATLLVIVQRLRADRWAKLDSFARRLAARPAPSQIRQAALASLALFPIWQWFVFVFDQLGSDNFAALSAELGTVTAFFVGLAWTVWGVERGSHYYLSRRASHTPLNATTPIPADLTANMLAFDGPSAAMPAPGEKIWNPVDLEAWYYGRKAPKLNQSLTTIFGYTIAFVILVFLFNKIGGCQEIYEMPAGGGGNSKGDKENSDEPQTVVVQKIIRKRFVINPYSSINFNIAPIENVPLNLKEATKHGYQIGQGKGDGAGFSGGTNRGKVRFIRLEYRGGDWDQDFGVGADLNMLLRYGIETGHQINEKTESRTIEELGRFVLGKSPPMVYMTGQQSIQLTKREIEILREYIIDKHGMIFADNGGSSQWHGQFFSMMDKVLEGTGVYPVKVPLDDVIHRIPFTLPFLPYVAPHGGKDAWGWYKDGRWLAYYHPGDIGDAWSDGHSGVRREVYEACYQLGVNVIFYAHAEYNKWLNTREKKE